jgi:hypothetical protein
LHQMAKGQVSEEELTKGLKGIGNFGGLSSSARVRRDNPFRDSRSEPAAPEPVKTIEVKPTTVEAKPKTVSPALEPKPVRTVAPVSKPAAKAQVAERKAKAVGGRKADIFTERVTLQISPEMRDEVERIARELQRAKSSKEERITANTVMRVAIQLITKKFKLGSGEAPNNEEKLYKFVEKMLGD